MLISPDVQCTHLCLWWKPWLTQYWVRQVKERAYGGITPDKGTVVMMKMKVKWEGSVH